MLMSNQSHAALILAPQQLVEHGWESQKDPVPGWESSCGWLTRGRHGVEEAPYRRIPVHGERQEGQPQKKWGGGMEGNGGESWSLEASGLERVLAQWWDDWSPQKRRPGRTVLECVSKKNSALAGCATQSPEAKTRSGLGWGDVGRIS